MHIQLLPTMIMNLNKLKTIPANFLMTCKLLIRFYFIHFITEDEKKHTLTRKNKIKNNFETFQFF